MRRRTLTLAGVALAAALGCQHQKPQLACEFPEEYNLPPDEARFNNPPESGYKKPPPKKETKPGMGGGGMGGGGFGNGMGGGSGMGGPGR